MHSLFTETRVLTTCEKLKKARQIKAIPIRDRELFTAFSGQKRLR